MEIASGQGSCRPDQFNNPANAATHEFTIGDEIWEQSGG